MLSVLKVVGIHQHAKLQPIPFMHFPETSPDEQTDIKWSGLVGWTQNFKNIRTNYVLSTEAEAYYPSQIM